MYCKPNDFFWSIERINFGLMRCATSTSDGLAHKAGSLTEGALAGSWVTSVLALYMKQFGDGAFKELGMENGPIMLFNDLG